MFEEHDSLVNPAATSRVILREATLSAGDGTSIFARAWFIGEPERVVVCVQGLGGHGGYYDDMAAVLAPSGTAVVAPDLRGHGKSLGQRGDIDNFDRYLDDVESAITWARSCWPDKPLFILGESMGASIAIHYIARAARRSPTAPAAGLVLLAPVLRQSVQPRAAEVVGYLRSLLLAPKRPSIATSGREEVGSRDAIFNDRLRADPLFVRYVSVRFLNNLARYIGRARRHAPAITLPLLILRGEHDHVAHVGGITTFLRHARTSDHRFVIFPEAFHSLLADPVTPNVLRLLNSWLVAHS